MKLLKILLLAAACVVALLGIGIAAIWAPDRPVADLIPTLAPPPSVFVDIEGMQVHVRDEGPADDPEPIVLLHGTSSSLHTWDGWAAALKGQRRVIRADLPGFGLTGPHPADQYDIASYSRFVSTLMDRLQVRRAVVAGNSLGGYAAWKTAVDFPDRVSRLILVDAAGYRYDSQSVPIGFKLARIPLLGSLTTRVLPRRVVASSVRNVYGDPDRVTPALIERYAQITLRAGNREAVVKRFSQIRGGEFEAQLRSVKQPTLILWGGQDRLIPLAYAQRFQRDIAGSQLVVFDGLGHVPHEEDPSATVKAVLEFLAAPNAR